MHLPSFLPQIHVSDGLLCVVLIVLYFKDENEWYPGGVTD